ncbi:hypothetical protein EDD86DRAFT_202173 [Gorgonomyces haynaldii]|nr:hypothetical protein EDD86DRAFT_202173 [Gorgonomyces haynaldii]
MLIVHTVDAIIGYLDTVCFEKHCQTRIIVNPSERLICLYNTDELEIYKIENELVLLHCLNEQMVCGRWQDQKLLFSTTDGHLKLLNLQNNDYAVTSCKFRHIHHIASTTDGFILFEDRLHLKDTIVEPSLDSLMNIKQDQGLQSILYVVQMLESQKLEIKIKHESSVDLIGIDKSHFDKRTRVTVFCNSSVGKIFWIQDNQIHSLVLDPASIPVGLGYSDYLYVIGATRTKRSVFSFSSSLQAECEVRLYTFSLEQTPSSAVVQSVVPQKETIPSLVTRTESSLMASAKKGTTEKKEATEKTNASIHRLEDWLKRFEQKQHEIEDKMLKLEDKMQTIQDFESIVERLSKALSKAEACQDRFDKRLSKMLE